MPVAFVIMWRKAFVITWRVLRAAGGAKRALLSIDQGDRLPPPRKTSRYRQRAAKDLRHIIAKATGMEAGLRLAMRVVPLGFILLGFTFALMAAIIKVSERKGLFRLAASIAVALGFAIGGAAQMTGERRIWPGCFGLVASCFLAWIGFRKFNRDPEGRTPPASML